MKKLLLPLVLCLSAMACNPDKKALQPQINTISNTPSASIYPGNPVTFTANVANNAGGAFVYSWDFGDGNTSLAEKPVHRYKSPGVYGVVLNVSGKRGQATKTMAVKVNEYIGNVSFWSGSPHNGLINVKMNDAQRNITGWQTQDPGCTMNMGTALFHDVPWGAYTYEATAENGKKWSGTLQVNEACQSVRLN